MSVDMREITHCDIASFVVTHVPLREVVQGKEFCGPCPLCGGDDRFRVWKEVPFLAKGRFWCRQCGVRGDLLDFIRLFDDKLTFLDAYHIAIGRKRTKRDIEHMFATPSNEQTSSYDDTLYKTQTRLFAQRSHATLLDNENAKIWSWLSKRGIGEKEVIASGLGFNNARRFVSGPSWGLLKVKTVFLPRGLVIPWGGLSPRPRLNFRVPTGKQKYISINGYTQDFYYGNHVRGADKAIVFEGELDVIAARSYARLHGVALYATGGAMACMKPPLLEKLRAYPTVFLSFDNDSAGDKAYTWWGDRLPNSVELRPGAHDFSDMIETGKDAAAWFTGVVRRTQLNML